MFRPGLNDLDAVIAIACRGSFRGAALDLGMSTTALSNAIVNSKRVSASVFRSHDAQRSLTDAGRVFVEQVTSGLEDIHGAIEVVRSQ
jgi:DNA-binding transcriptional LysR family regulator